MSTMRLFLEDDLSPRTHANVLSHAERFQVDPTDGAGLSWLIELMKFLPDRPNVFVTGKYNTITACQKAVEKAAKRCVDLVINPAASGGNHERL